MAICTRWLRNVHLGTWPGLARTRTGPDRTQPPHCLVILDLERCVTAARGLVRDIEATIYVLGTGAVPKYNLKTLIATGTSAVVGPCTGLTRDEAIPKYMERAKSGL